jgi:endonuclease YncB( thermonuclease family)
VPKLLRFTCRSCDIGAKKLPRFAGKAPDIGKTGGIKLRLEVIDALESHYPTDKGRGPDVHQSLDLAFAARDELLQLLGFTNVEFNPDSTIQSADAFLVEGFILANGIDPNGRVIGFAYAGDNPPKPNGKRLRLTTEFMEESANIQLLQQGLAYTTLYQTLPFELIQHARELTQKAREKKLGVFGAEDVGLSTSAKIANLVALEKLVMFPKLFRRLADFFFTTGDSLSEFDEWVREEAKRDDQLILPSGEVGNLHDVYTIENGRLQLNFNPEDIQVLK